MIKKLNLFRNILIGMILLIDFGNSKAQSGWQDVLVESGDAFFTDIWFVAGSDGLWKTGWVLDYYGTIYKTEDGGDTWVEYTLPISSKGSNICFVDESIGYFCTYDGQIYKSTDGGQNWVQQLNNPAGWFSAIIFKDALNGIVSGTPNMYTNNGGTTWNLATGGDSDEPYGYAAYADGDTYFSTEMGFTYPPGSIGKSTNNGQSWNNIVNGIDFLPNYIACYGANHIITGGASELVYFSHDGGTTWNEANTDDEVGDALVFAWFDADTVWAAGTDIYKSTDGGYNWTVDTVIGPGAHREIFCTPTNVVYVANDIITASQTIWRKIGGIPLNADFEANPAEVCAGSSVSFTDLSYFPPETWSWTFEGGNPSISTDQNPTVMYDTPGMYDVTLTVTLLGEESTITKTNYIYAVELPEQTEIPSGEANICNGGIYEYSVPEVEYGTSYIWEMTPATAGTLTVEMNEATLASSLTWNGDFTLKVKAHNACGDSPWSDVFTGTLHPTPESFALEGGGGFCEGGEGVEITLAGSENGIIYELYLDGVATGLTAAGNGSAISFGLVTESGWYEVMASSDFCSILMPDQIEVFYYFLPETPGQLTGPEVACNVESSDYTSSGSEDADSYIWNLSPVEAGTISATELEATVTWNESFSGNAYVSVAAVNECGTGEAATLEVAVNTNFTLTIEGADLTCDFQSEEYSTQQDETFTYTWEVSGGTITDGQGTAQIIVNWGGEGYGSIVVNAISSEGCNGTSDNFPVMIDDCTGLDENQDSESPLSVYPNPAQNKLNIAFNMNDLKKYSVTIFDAKGMKFYEENIHSTDNVTLNIELMKPGLYFLTINSGNQTVAAIKFVKE